jgi:uncharacterized protein
MIQIAGLILLGLLAGVSSGLLGIGGAVVMIPVLVFVFGFEQKLAQGTTLMLMVPPIGALAAYEYYKKGFTDIKAALIIALFFLFGGLVGSKIAVKMDPVILRKIFAVSLLLISIKMFFK